MSEELTVAKAIQFAVATEDIGVRAYSKLAERFSDQEEIRDVFSHLAKDEKAHRAQFQALLGKVPPEEGVMSDGEKSRYLQAMATSQFFRGDAGLAGRLDKAQSLQEVLLEVLGFEKATLGYYLAVKDVLGESEALTSVIEAEKSHIVLTPQQKDARLSSLYREALEGLFPEEQRLLWKRRLEEVAYILWKQGHEKEACRAVRAAIDLTTPFSPIDPNPFCWNLLLKSLYGLLETERGEREQEEKSSLIIPP